MSQLHNKGCFHFSSNQEISILRSMLHSILLPKRYTLKDLKASSWMPKVTILEESRRDMEPKVDSDEEDERMAQAGVEALCKTLEKGSFGRDETRCQINICMRCRTGICSWSARREKSTSPPCEQPSAFRCFPLYDTSGTPL